MNHLIKELKMPLPDEFLKKWLSKRAEQPLSIEESDKHFENYAKSIRERLIKEKIFKENNIKIQEQDLASYAENYITENFSNAYPDQKIPDKDLEQLKSNFLKDNKFVNEVVEILVMENLMLHFEKTYHPVIEEISLDKFLESDKKTQEVH